jgi:tRNA U34 2-thiouridine synthase MnmA/TrmU
MAKAVGLFSAGLDSILAVMLILEQQIEVLGVTFISYFFDNSQQAQTWANRLGIPLKIIRLPGEYLKIVKCPKYGYGRNLNPCIDCHIYMLKKAKLLMEELKADFVFTGEVLNERPMSQNRHALLIIEKESGLNGKLLRPLSAQLLEPTTVEILGIVNRQLLGRISGRSRKPQIELAHKYGIFDFPQPAGGCLLTDSSFSKRLKDAFLHYEETERDIELLKIGRHFRLDDALHTKVIVGRNKQENERLRQLAQTDDIILEPLYVPGPIVLIPNRSPTEEIINLAGKICARYTDRNNQALVKLKFNDIIIEAEPLGEEMINKYRI